MITTTRRTALMAIQAYNDDHAQPVDSYYQRLMRMPHHRPQQQLDRDVAARIARQFDAPQWRDN